MNEDLNYASWPLDVGRYIDVGDHKQVFLDDGFLLERAEGVRYAMQQPVKHSRNPLLIPETGELQVQLYGSVLWDEEEHLFKMWYTQRVHKYDKDSAVTVGYALSDDGLSWSRPKLGLVRDAPDNAVLDPGPGGSGGVCVLHTPWDQKPEQRYKMLYKTIEKGGGLQVAFSPDGVRWTPHAQTVLPGVFDTFNVALWDGRTGQYVAYVRINQRPRKRYRHLGRIESPDFIHWTVPAMVLGPDAQDPEDADLYTSAAFRYEEADAAYFMMPSLFDWRTGQLSIQLATSRDGAHWRRAGNRAPFIPLGLPDSFEANQVAAGAPPVVKGEKIHIYYHGTDQRHWGGTGPDRPIASGIGVATLRLDGFIALVAGERPAGGTVTTVPIRFSGSRLEVNAEAGWGEIRVEVLDEAGDVIPGFGRDGCAPVTGDSVRHAVAWEQGDPRSLAGQTVKLRFHLRCASLYAFQFRGP